MRNFTLYLAFAICLLASKLSAQDSFEYRARAIAEKIENITKDEKAALKAEIESVNTELENGTIAKSQADEKKMQLAEARAKSIETKVAQAQEELKDLVQQKVDGKINDGRSSGKNSIELLSVDDNNRGKNSIELLSVKWKERDSISYKGKKYKVTYKTTDSLYVDINGVRKAIKSRKRLGESRTTSQFVFAAGINNLVTNGSVANSDFRYWGSHFYEWGFTANYRLLKNDNLLHLKYGFSVMYNNLRPTDNRAFVINGLQTNLETSTVNLSDSRFRNVYVTFPVHLEFDFSKTKEVDGKKIFRSHKSVRLGIGGYAGFRVKSKQILEYSLDGHDVTQRARGGFNTNDFIYGISSYVGYKETSIYLKYDLNPLFKNNDIKQNNISLGVRFDLN